MISLYLLLPYFFSIFNISFVVAQLLYESESNIHALCIVFRYFIHPNTLHIRLTHRFVESVLKEYDRHCTVMEYGICKWRLIKTDWNQGRHIWKKSSIFVERFPVSYSYIIIHIQSNFAVDRSATTQTSENGGLVFCKSWQKW